MFWKLILAFNIIAWTVIIPYMMSDIEQTLDHCQELTQSIEEY